MPAKANLSPRFYLKQGFIDRDERKRLVTEATHRYAQAVEGVGEGA
jgi:Holliday junction resolvasome RuvABC ATP-dependent DNA helicase subunit